MKFLPDEFATRPELKARFLREARAMAALDHRGIVAIHDLREEDVGPLVMLVVEPLGDGRVVSRARFEPGPILGAVVALGLSFAACSGSRSSLSPRTASAR